MSQQQPSRTKTTGYILYFCFVLLSLSPFAAVWDYLSPGPLVENKTVIIPHGTSTREISNLLASNGVISYPLVFRVAAKLVSGDSLKSGEYEFTSGQSMADIMLIMHEGHSVVHLLTVAEGLTTTDIEALLKNTPALTGDVAHVAEGSLLPETYRYSYGDSRNSIINRMQKDMQETLNSLWEKRDPAIPLKSAKEAVVLASLIEKETGKAIERPRIAGVFYNRLRTNMRLQSDPTVIYAITLAKGPMSRELVHDDMAFPSPFNTYVSDGLPPEPICNPGRASIEAALHPEQNEFIYFVADGTGGHVFSKDLAQHNQNVTKWNEIKRH